MCTLKNDFISKVIDNYKQTAQKNTTEHFLQSNIPDFSETRIHIIFIKSLIR